MSESTGTEGLDLHEQIDYWRDAAEGWESEAKQWKIAYTQLQSAYQELQNDRLVRTCERALIAILRTLGGFPAAEGDDVCRQIVREIRKMYEELKEPTTAPVQTQKSPVTDFDLLDADADAIEVAEFTPDPVSLDADPDDDDDDPNPF